MESGSEEWETYMHYQGPGNPKSSESTSEGSAVIQHMLFIHLRQLYKIVHKSTKKMAPHAEHNPCIIIHRKISRMKKIQIIRCQKCKSWMKRNKNARAIQTCEWHRATRYHETSVIRFALCLEQEISRKLQQLTRKSDLATLQGGYS